MELHDGPLTFGACVVNGDTPAGRRRMTAAHELGHWLNGDAYDAAPTATAEQMVNSFAIHFLAPRAGVKTVWAAAPAVSPRFAAGVVNGYVGRWLTADRAVELLRGTLDRADLPDQAPPTFDDLRRSFAGHDD